MSTTGATLIPIFATPFASLTLDVPEALNIELTTLFQSRANSAHRAIGAPVNPLCFSSRDDVLDWPDVPVQTLKRHLLGAIATVVGAITQHTEEQFGELSMHARGWFSWVMPNGGISARSYPQASWCAIYCVAAPKADASHVDNGMLRLYETRLSSAYFDASNWYLKPPFASGHHLWQPTAGAMAVFPAASLHEIARLRSDDSLMLVTVCARFADASQLSASRS